MAFINIERIKMATLADISYVVSERHLVTFLFVSVQKYNL